jgi:uncharacterized tellurite resistance protein B-like protein
MKISVLDASNYYKGLLLLVRKDRKISKSETDLMKRVGKSLGFEREFCENAIRDILENKYIVDTPPEFSAKELALMFLKDGLAIAFSDNEYDPAEKEWLRATAERNGIDPAVFLREETHAADRTTSLGRLEVDDLTVVHT